MSDTKTELQKIKEKAANPNISLSEISNLLEEWNKIVAPIAKDATKKEERMLASEVSESIYSAIFNSIDKWERGEIEPKKEEVFFLHDWCITHIKLEVGWAAFEESINKIEHADAEEKQQIIRVFKKIIEKLKSRDSTLRKLFQKWEEKYKEENEKTSSEENNDTSSSSASTTSSTTNKKREKGKGGLPGWGIALIIVGLLVVAGAAAYFILERKEKPKIPKKTKK